MPIEIRRATEDDWHVVRDIRLAALQQAPFAFGSTYQRERDFDEGTWRSRLRNPDGPTFLAFDDETPIGIDGIFTTENGDRHLVAMWVDPTARRQGVGVVLAQAVIGWARGVGAPRLLLGVAEDNAPAIALYESLAFKFSGKREPLRSNPNHSVLEMSLELAEQV